MRHLPLAITIMLASIPVVGFAQESPIRVTESLGGSIDGLGVQNTIEATLGRSMFRDARPLFSQNHIAAGAIHALTPAYSRIVGYLEVSPLSILDLGGGYEKSSYFGTFGSVQSFGSYADRFGDDERARGKSRAEAGGASCFFFSPSLKMKAGSIAASASTHFEWWHADVRGPFFYEPGHDTLLRAGHDRVITTTAYAVKLRELPGRGRLAIGVRYAMTYVPNAPQNKSQRIGITAARDFGEHRFGVRSPRLSGHISYYLSDPNRRGGIGAGLALAFELTHREAR